ncbi:MAG: preprotein translocase subunit SecG [Patescibacteria group bacterium]
MKAVLDIAQIVVSVALAGLVLLQAKGTGLGRSFKSTSFHSRRGVESLVFKTTIVLAIVFVCLSLFGHFV